MAWYNASWSHRAEVEIDAAYVDEAVPVIPVYLSGFDSTWHTAVQADGDDIRVTQSDGTTLLDYYLVSYDSGTDTGLIMVNVDGYISASVNVTLYVYVGNSGASAGSTTDTFTGTGYVGVYFPGESTSDASGGSRNLTAVNAPTTTAVAAYEIDAATYNGSDEYHGYDGTQGVTAWPMSLELLLAPGSTSLQYVSALTVYASSDNIFGLYTNSGGLTAAVLGNGGSAASATQNSAVSNGTWAYVMASRDATSGTSYARAPSGAASNATTINAYGTADRFTIGALRYSSSTILYYTGSVAFAALSSVARSADYYATMLDAWNTSAFRTYGATEAQPSGDTGWLEFTAAATSAGGGATNWTSASNALTSLATAATCNLADGDITYQLNLTNAATAITGLLDEISKIEIELIATGEDGGSQELVDENIKLIVGGSVTGNDKSDLVSWTDASQVTKTYTWSPSLGDSMPTPAQVDSTTFGVSLQFYSQGGATALMSVYRARVRIYSRVAGAKSGFFGLLQ